MSLVLLHEKRPRSCVVFGLKERFLGYQSNYTLTDVGLYTEVQ